MTRHSRNGAATIHAIGASVILAALGVVFFGGVRPIMEQRRVERAATVEAAALRVDLNLARTEFAEVERARDEVEARVGSSRVELQPLGALNAQVAGLTALLEGAGLTIESMTPGQPERAARHASVRIRVVGRGSYTGATRALDALHGAFPDVHVELVRVRAGSAGASEDGTFEFVCVWIAGRAGAAGRASEET